MNKKEAIYELRNFSLDRYHLQLNEALFHNANGYIGVRYDFEEGYPKNFPFVRSQYINGFYNYEPVHQPETLYGLVRKKQIMLNVANTQTIQLSVDGEEFNMFTGTVLESSLSLHMDKGVTIRKVIWRSPSGKELALKITRMASFHQLSLFTIEYEVTPLNFSGNIVIESGHDVNVSNFYDPSDPRSASEPAQSIIPVSCEIKHNASYITAVTSESALQMCSCVYHVVSQDCERDFLVNNNTAICRFSLEAKQMDKVQLIKYSVFCDSIRFDNWKKQAADELQNALSIPLAELYQKQEAYLAKQWDNCQIEIDGDDESNLALRYNMYQLIQSVGKDPHSNIAPKGLSGDGYEGHYFWDSEIYIQPFFTITNPSISRNLIDFRYQTLDMARMNARLLGHSQGALYPWRTIMGTECSGFFPAGSAQYHINGAIAYSIIAYYLASKDLDFIIQKGAEIIFETARIWISVGNYHEGQFFINGVTGPDEYTCIVNNNYYTNALAKYHLQWAVKFYELLKQSGSLSAVVEKLGLTEDEFTDFAQAANQMYLPYDQTLKINPQDDSFLQKSKLDLSCIPQSKFPLLLHFHPLFLYRHQVCKQADTVLAHFLLDDLESEEIMRNSFLYYEGITTHDSSLSRCIFGIMAARFGMEEQSFQYFSDSLKLDLMDLQRNTKDGIHTANMAGNYLAIVYGFGGFRLKEEGISFAPILPKKWSGYHFFICYEDSRLKVEVYAQTCIFTLLNGSAKQIRVYGTEYLLDDRLVISKNSGIDQV
jgi:alpha,alpha-trehalose phosphorylase